MVLPDGVFKTTMTLMTTMMMRLTMRDHHGRTSQPWPCFHGFLSSSPSPLYRHSITAETHTGVTLIPEKADKVLDEVRTMLDFGWW
jgi:hypothetical protein